MERKAYALLRQIERSWWYRGRALMVHVALARIRVLGVSDILDFGAGYGGMYRELSGVGKNVYAFEPDAEAKAAAQKRGYRRIFLSECAALARRYDLIGLFDVVEHIEHDRQFLQKVHSALKRDGRLAITVPAFQFLWSEHDANHHHYRRYGKASMVRALSESGYVVEFASYWNMMLFIPAALIRLLGHSGERTLGMPCAINAIFFSVVLLESWLMRFAPLPFGTGLVIVARKK